ncbi:CPBP family intramembrane glutamic endopeptidase [Gracilinema caldarium]|uniref:Abortive infection protein n=1 Tax=Gracilinema caldarium (strain ATCC 51460 / DSM 7334 / H1) TaxID=744872 RepID=F8F323_GRAC1|nr:CPBP family intramembrane glutamic endopeptidase [Gracilinema caldarium]AEJ19931.1 Abortive infection protein [Gracilinema caldarium DSM 7334]
MNNQEIKPLGTVKSICYFGILGTVFYLSYHYLRIYLLKNGFSDISSYLVSLGTPAFLLFCISIFYYKIIEKRELSIPEFSKRMNLPKFTWKDITWGLGLFVCGFLGYGLATFLTKYVISICHINIPTNIAILDIPDLQITKDVLNQAAGGQIVNKWYLVLLFAVVLFFNIFGEELLWRGIILPKQKIVFKKNAWILNGTLWALFHFFKWWDIINLLPTCLLIAYVSQKRSNNWSGIIAHSLMNISGFIVITLAVAGVY